MKSKVIIINTALFFLCFTSLIGFGTLLKSSILKNKKSITSLDRDRNDTKKIESKNYLFFDFDSDGVEDFLLLKKTPNTYLLKSYSMGGTIGASQKIANFKFKIRSWEKNNKNEIPLVADYNGDGVFDFAFFSPKIDANQNSKKTNWEISYNKRSGDTIQEASLEKFTFGGPNAIPVVGNFDNDNVSDIAYFDKHTTEWAFMLSKHGFNQIKSELGIRRFGFKTKWGNPGDTPLVADFNGDGISEIVSIGNSNGRLIWKIKYVNIEGEKTRERIIEFGKFGDIPITTDINCDKKQEIAIYDQKEKTWIIRVSKDKIKKISWEQEEDLLPFTADFDGDSCPDLASYAPHGILALRFLPSSFKESLIDKITDERKFNSQFTADNHVIFSFNFGAKDEKPYQAILKEFQLRN